MWESRAGLNLSLEQVRVLERHWKGFVKSGARLAKPEQERLSAINETLAGIGAKFGQNELADEKSWVLFLDEAPEFRPGVMQALCQPIESGHVVVARAIGTPSTAMFAAMRTVKTAPASSTPQR